MCSLNAEIAAISEAMQHLMNMQYLVQYVSRSALEHVAASCRTKWGSDRPSQALVIVRAAQWEDERKIHGREGVMED